MRFIYVANISFIFEKVPFFAVFLRLCNVIQSFCYFKKYSKVLDTLYKISFVE